MKTENKEIVEELLDDLGETLGPDHYNSDKFDLEEEKRNQRKDLGYIALGTGVLTGVEGYATYAQFNEAQKQFNEAARVAGFPEYIQGRKDPKEYLTQHNREIDSQNNYLDTTQNLAVLTGATALVFAFVAGKYLSKLIDACHERKMGVK